MNRIEQGGFAYPGRTGKNGQGALQPFLHLVHTLAGSDAGGNHPVPGRGVPLNEMLHLGSIRDQIQFGQTDAHTEALPFAVDEDAIQQHRLERGLPKREKNYGLFRIGDRRPDELGTARSNLRHHPFPGSRPFDNHIVPHQRGQVFFLKNPPRPAPNNPLRCPNIVKTAHRAYDLSFRHRQPPSSGMRSPTMSQGPAVSPVRWTKDRSALTPIFGSDMPV